MEESSLAKVLGSGLRFVPSKAISPVWDPSLQNLGVNNNNRISPLKIFTRRNEITDVQILKEKIYLKHKCPCAFVQVLLFHLGWLFLGGRGGSGK